MRTSQLKQSNYLTKSDCGQGILVTIKSVFEQDVAMEGDEQKVKWCMSFNELDKAMILNITNGAIIEAIFKSDNSDDWIGKQIVLYEDPAIMFHGKPVGGIRVRAPKGKAAASPAIPQPAHRANTPAKAVAPIQEADDDSSVPF